MATLDEIMKWKQVRDAEETASLDAIPNALLMYAKGAEVKQKNMIDNLTTAATLAKLGLVYDQKNNTIKQDEGLLNATTRQTGVFGFNPITGELSQVASVPKGSAVRNQLSLEERGQMAEKSREAVTENPSLDTDTQRAIAAYEYIQPRLGRIDSALKAGALDDKGFSRFAKDIIVQKSGDLVVPPGHPLEDLIGAINDIKLTGFSLGGATFTGTEAEKIEGRLNPLGKSLERYRKDIASLPEFFQAKAKSGLRGLKESKQIVEGNESIENFKSGGNFSDLSDDELRKLAGI